MKTQISDIVATGSIIWSNVDEPDAMANKLFHSWRAQTSSFLSSITPDKVRGDAVGDVADILEEAVEPICSYRSRRALAAALAVVARKALALDEAMSCQQKWYFFNWPEKRHDITFDKSYMRAVKGNGSIVAFVIRPALLKTGGERGEDYVNWQPVEDGHCTVVLSSRYW